MATVIGFLVLLAGGRPLAGVSAGIVAGLTSGALARMAAARVDTQRQRHLAVALTLLNGELSAGASESVALTASATVAGSFAPVLHRAAGVAARGGDVAAELVSDGPELDALAAAWRVRARCGAALAEIISHVERDLADSGARRREVDSALAGPRASAGLLALLPVVGVGLGTGMGAHPVAFLLTSAPGSMILLLGVALDAGGLWWVRRMVHLAGVA